jgi:transcriptional regulator with XRE-family HTH domain
VLVTGRDLRRLRRSVGVTQYELSVFSSLFHANVHQLESGRRKITPNLELRLRAAIAAGKLLQAIADMTANCFKILAGRPGLEPG